MTPKNTAPTLSTIVAGKSGFSWRRLNALCVKETLQILRDPASWLIAILIPILLLLIFSYGINLDTNRLNIGILQQQDSDAALSLSHTLDASPFITATVSHNRQQLTDLMQAGKIRGIVVIPVDFAERLASPSESAPIQLITDGSEPNTALFVQSYLEGSWQIWRQQYASDHNLAAAPLINLEFRYWFNPAAVSQNFIIPGAISIIMTVTGAILTSLVIAREWERGTMEALLSTEVTRTELLLCKLLPYYFLGMLAMLICILFSMFIVRIPIRGSLLVIFLVSSLFLFSTLGMGLLISTLTRNQFNASQVALNAAFLPAVMLSGFVFQINSMPLLIRLFTWLVPARYFVSALQTLFLSGNVLPVLLKSSLLLTGATIAFIGLTWLTTKRRLD